MGASLLCSAPYGFVLGGDAAIRVALLFVGSVALCWPSLHVFSGYLGCRVSALQNLVIALLISAVAGMFALGFVSWGGLAIGYHALGLCAVGYNALGMFGAGFNVRAGFHWTWGSLISVTGWIAKLIH